jgi:hypothetical protein
VIFTFIHATADEAYDGDTFWANIDLGLRMYTRQKVRLRHVKAVELKDEGGPRARAVLEEVVPLGTPIEIVSHGWTYDRIEGDVYLQDSIRTNVGEVVLEMLARKGLVGGR